MPRNLFQRMVFAFLTVLVTVHAYVFYSLYVVNGSLLMTHTQTNSVLAAINAQGGVYMCGCFCPIRAVVILEFILAYVLELIMGSPCSFKLTNMPDGMPSLRRSCLSAQTIHESSQSIVSYICVLCYTICENNSTLQSTAW